MRGTIAINAPKPGNSHAECEEWLEKFSAPCYSKTLFYKGPLIYADDKYSHVISPATLISYKVYRKRVKDLLLKAQTQGEGHEWQFNNFALNDIAGLRRSERN